MFRFEIVVKAPGDLFNVKGGSDAACHIYNAYAFLLIKTEGDAV